MASAARAQDDPWRGAWDVARAAEATSGQALSRGDGVLTRFARNP